MNFFYRNLDLKNFLDNKKFWKNIKPFFSEKGPRNKKITLVTGEKIFSEDSEVSESFNNFFSNAVRQLDIAEHLHLLNKTKNTDDPIDSAIEKFRYHPSILKIQEKVNSQIFNFTNVTLAEVEQEVRSLNPKKATTTNSIPSKLLKQHFDIYGPILHNLVNKTFQENIFPDELKLGDITPIFKKDDATNVKNYRPISVLPAASKIFERLLKKQIISHIEEHLSPYLCGYRKGFNTQHALIALIEKWKISLDKNGYAGAILMDLSKAFDTLNHDLLLAKLNAYGFSKNSLTLVRSYLKNRWQRIKINTAFSTWTELLLGVPQGSVLGPLLFNIYINDLFWVNEQTDVCNYADDTTFHTTDQDLNALILRLEHDSLLAIEWFEANYMKLNEDKCHLLISGHKFEHVWAMIGNARIWESQHQKLLGVTIDKNLKFNNHISDMCIKASRKLTALGRLSRLLPFAKRRLLMKSFIETQFSYCPLIWMFHDRNLNNKINKLHERTLRMLYKDDCSTFNELLIKDGSVSVHNRNIQIVAIEMYKSKHGLSPELLKDIFIDRLYQGPTLRSLSEFVVPQVNTIHYGHDSLHYFGAKIWNMIPAHITNIDSLEKFKTEIKKWTPNDCPCRLCKTCMYAGWAL